MCNEINENKDASSGRKRCMSTLSLDTKAASHGSFNLENLLLSILRRLMNIFRKTSSHLIIFNRKTKVFNIVILHRFINLIERLNIIRIVSNFKKALINFLSHTKGFGIMSFNSLLSIFKLTIGRWPSASDRMGR